MRPRTKSGFASKAKSTCTEKEAEVYQNPRPAAAAASSSVRFPFGFLTAFVNVILVLAPRTAKCSVGPAAQEYLLAVLAQAQGLVIIHQHKTEHHLDTQQQRVKIPVDGGLIQQLDVVAGGDPAKCGHGFAIQPPCVLIKGVIIIVVQDGRRQGECPVFELLGNPVVGFRMDQYIPAVERMYNIMKKYQVAFTETTVENKKLKQENAQLEQSLEKATQESTLKQLADAKLRRDYADAVAVLERIPKEVLAEYMHKPDRRRINAYDR